MIILILIFIWVRRFKKILGDTSG